jgi:dienelactone hydrolase
MAMTPMSPRLSVSGERLMDAPSGLRITRCTPGAPVEVICSTDVNGAVHESRSVFVADEAGTVDVARHPSVGGSYRGIDPFGLWWSAGPGRPAPPRQLGAPVVSHIEVRCNRRSLAAEMSRDWLVPGASAQRVSESGIHGLFCRPAGPGPFPGVVAFGGSGGGLGPAATWAPALASRGLAALAISYFREPGLPNALVGIEVEVVERAARWLLTRPDVRPPTISVIGQSRGSELALLAGAFLPEVRGVVGIAPSGVVWPALDGSGPVDKPAWTFRGEPFPYMPIGAEASVANTWTRQGPVALRPAFDEGLRRLTVGHEAVIPVERIDGPVLLISGRDDTMWPSTPMSEIAECRAAASGRPHLVSHLSYDAAGHMCAGVPGLPVIIDARHPLTGVEYSFGGTRSGNARARIDSWPQIVEFLQTAGFAEHVGSSAAAVRP